MSQKVNLRLVDAVCKCNNLLPVLDLAQTLFELNPRVCCSRFEVFFFLSIVRFVWFKQQPNNRREQGFARDEHSAPPAPAGRGSVGSCAPEQGEMLPAGHARGCLPSFTASSGLWESQVCCFLMSYSDALCSCTQAERNSLPWLFMWTDLAEAYTLLVNLYTG